MSTATCELCGKPMKVRPAAHSQKYHPACKRQVDRMRAKRAPARHAKTCVICGRSFVAKRADAQVCSPRCRLRKHRAGR